ALLAYCKYDNNVGGTTVKIVDAASGKELQSLAVSRSLLQTMALHPHRKSLLTCDNTAHVKLWNVQTGEELRAWQIPGGVNAFAFSSDGKRFASANSNGTVYVYRFND
ncbi:MAG: WD40 repeat domain-containing protein, partial [Gemmataceae bacterium]